MDRVSALNAGRHERTRRARTTRRRRAEYTQGPPQVNAGNLGFGRQNRALAPQPRPVAGEKSPTYKRRAGEVPEWSIGTVSKTVVRASVPWVRIPPSPPIFFSRTPFYKDSVRI